MTLRLLRASLILSAVFLAGCNESLEDIAPKASQELSPKLVAEMKTKSMTPASPIMVRIFKEEGQLEVWKQKSNGRYDLLSSFDICKWSGKLGPKYVEGDRQAPEGFYTVSPGQMNPKSSFYLSFNIGFPNAYDKVHGRTGQHLMVHGACSSSGCYSMTDAQVAQIYALAREAFKGGQTSFQIQAFPFRMTAANMARYKDDPNYKFWTMLKEGYDHFEITKVPPKVDVCEKRYVFNQVTEPGRPLSPAGACPATPQPEALQTAYQTYTKSYEAAFTMAASGASKLAPMSSIAGLKEAALVAEWSKKRSRGERVPLEPPSLNPDGSVTQTDRMGRIDSPAGRRMAALEAEKEAKEKAEQAKKSAEVAAALPAAVAVPAAAQAMPVSVSPETGTAEPRKGFLSSLRKRMASAN
ncbi:L,D-transpeptidase family protein [Tianweitania sediminis]|uniref:Murein L,D-transpeptidase n=1 Tax=Tianweitania sediminis TaxID=1502156 RepID=A0A8J7R0L4_9HYPH|nr:murein L,D-transpeptidase family protein [Tianweitania sediminis]MBP0437875.1 murein L,D-transpeptidase [Tianweitania sediminis]